jgi:hypothetical protein
LLSLCDARRASLAALSYALADVVVVVVGVCGSGVDDAAMAAVTTGARWSCCCELCGDE